MTSPGSSTCAVCRFRLSRTMFSTERLHPGQVQIRGKKKNAKARTTIDVRLAKDLEGYGRRGAVVPMPIGQMRNYFYPRRIADYVPWFEARELRKTGYLAQRDFSFGKQTEDDQGVEVKDTMSTLISQPARATRRAQAVRVDLDMLQPDDTFELLSRILPASINFYRAPIEQSDPVKSGETPQPSVSSPAIPGPSTSIYPNQTTSIYGSVTTADVTTSLKALLAANEEAAGRVVMAEEDVRFITGTEDATRAKHLGDFDIEINIRGAGAPVRRKIRVLAEEEAPEDLDLGDQAVEELAAQQPVAGEPSDEWIYREAEMQQRSDEVEGFVQDARQDLEDLRAQSDERDMTPAEAAEKSTSGNMDPTSSVVEGLVERDQNTQAPTKARSRRGSDKRSR